MKTLNPQVIKDMTKIASQEMNNAISNYGNRVVTPALVETMKAHLTTQLGAFAAAYSIPTPLPIVSVTINGSVTTYKFYDRKTNTETTLADWIAAGE